MFINIGPQLPIRENDVATLALLTLADAILKLRLNPSNHTTKSYLRVVSNDSLLLLLSYLYGYFNGSVC